LIRRARRCLIAIGVLHSLVVASGCADVHTLDLDFEEGVRDGLPSGFECGIISTGRRLVERAEVVGTQRRIHLVVDFLVASDGCDANAPCTPATCPPDPDARRCLTLLVDEPIERTLFTALNDLDAPILDEAPAGCVVVRAVGTATSCERFASGPSVGTPFDEGALLGCAVSRRLSFPGVAGTELLGLPVDNTDCIPDVVQCAQ
jgi:hypothetical protein